MKKIIVGVILVIATVVVVLNWNKLKTVVEEPGQPFNYTIPLSTVHTEEITEGQDREVKAGDRVEVHYTLFLNNGHRVESSLNRGEPFSFVVGRGEVFRGWDDGMLGMKLGGKRRIVAPPDMAYGNRGDEGRIPPASTLVVDVELLSIK